MGGELLFQLIAAAPAEWKSLHGCYIDYAGDCRRPDLVVVRSSALLHGSDLAFLPADVALVVEIVSDSSRRTDRLAKPAEYADEGIPLFWRVELEPEVVVHPFRLVEGAWLAEPEIRGTGIAPVPWGSIDLDLSALS